MAGGLRCFRLTGRGHQAEVSGADSPILVLLVTRPTSGVGRRMESVLARVQGKERARVRIGRVDADAQPELVERLGVREIPSVVVVKDRTPVAWLAGRVTLEDIEQALSASGLEPVRNVYGLDLGPFPADGTRVPTASCRHDRISGR